MSNSSTEPPLASVGLSQIIPATKILIDALLHRGELAAVELVEAREQVFTTMLFGIAAVTLTLLGGFAVTLCLAAAIWERPDRVLILGLVGLVYLVGSGLLLWLCTRRLHAWRPLKETRKQLSLDRSCFYALITPPVERHSRP